MKYLSDKGHAWMMWFDFAKNKQCLTSTSPLKCKSGQTFFYLEVVSGSQISFAKWAVGQ